jgi:uncharacterized FlaG/YvyC family protein
MRIDGPQPVPLPPHQPAAETENKNPGVAEAQPAIQDEVVQHAPETRSVNVVVEMQAGNILVYKFIDEASGQVIQQIPADQMIKLSEGIETAQKSSKQK